MLRAAHVNRISPTGRFEIALHDRLRTAADCSGPFENARSNWRRRQSFKAALQGLRKSLGRLEFSWPESAACGSRLRRAYRPDRSCGRVAEGGGLLNRYRVVKPYRGFESLRLRQLGVSSIAPVKSALLETQYACEFSESQAPIPVFCRR
jgi:hypothetical protein